MERRKNNPDAMFDRCINYENSFFEDVINALVTAMEGGSNYWYCLETLGFGFKEEIPHSIQIIDAVMYNDVAFAVTDIDDEGNLLGYLSFENIERGYDLFKSEYKGVDLSEVDAELADIFFQYVIMGEVVYG